MVARLCGRPRLAVVPDVVLPELLSDRFDTVVVIFKESWFAPLRRVGITFAAFAKRHFPERRFIVIHHLEACGFENVGITCVIYDSIVIGGNGDDFVFSADGEAPIHATIVGILIVSKNHTHVSCSIERWLPMRLPWAPSTIRGNYSGRFAFTPHSLITRPWRRTLTTPVSASRS